MINVLGPDHLDQLIPAQVSLTSSYNLRNSEDYLTVCTNTQLYYNSFLPSVVREWDSFPDSNKNAATLESLIRRLITGVEFISRRFCIQYLYQCAMKCSLFCTCYTNKTEFKPKMPKHFKNILATTVHEIAINELVKLTML